MMMMNIHKKVASVSLVRHFVLTRFSTGLTVAVRPIKFCSKATKRHQHRVNI